MFAKATRLVCCLAAFVVCSISFSGWAETFEEIKEMAEQGDANAQSILGKMYAHGQGVLQDYARAHMWYNIAGANGHEEGPEERDNVAEKMTSDQIAEAQRMASEMLEANPKVLGE